MTRRTFARVALVLIVYATVVVIGIVAPVVFLGAAVGLMAVVLLDVLIRWADFG